LGTLSWWIPFVSAVSFFIIVFFVVFGLFDRLRKYVSKRVFKRRRYVSDESSVITIKDLSFDVFLSDGAEIRLPIRWEKYGIRSRARKKEISNPLVASGTTIQHPRTPQVSHYHRIQALPTSPIIQNKVALLSRNNGLDGYFDEHFLQRGGDWDNATVMSILEQTRTKNIIKPAFTPTLNFSHIQEGKYHSLRQKKRFAMSGNGEHSINRGPGGWPVSQVDDLPSVITRSEDLSGYCLVGNDKEIEEYYFFRGVDDGISTPMHKTDLHGLSDRRTGRRMSKRDMEK